ncbi:MAG: PHP domain-containing protein [Vampirovibrionia bacterium]
MKLDLHVHSNFSDGVLTPEEIIDICVKDEIKVISITDHDTVNAIPIAKQAAEGKDVEIIPGVEINTIWNDDEVHILGYYMDVENDFFQEIIETQQKARVQQAEQIIKNLITIAKIPITIDDIYSQVLSNGVVGRPHIARAIYRKGGARNIQEAYIKYINDNAPTYIRRDTVTPHEAVEAIYEAGGIPVIAHPKEMENVEEFVKELMSYGLRGIEAYHKSHSPALVEYHSCLAEKLGLIVTGGSDCHGPRGTTPYFIGKNLVPEWVYVELKKEKARLESASYKAG